MRLRQSLDVHQCAPACGKLHSGGEGLATALTQGNHSLRCLVCVYRYQSVVHDL